MALSDNKQRKCAAPGCEYVANSYHELQAHSGLMHEAAPAPVLDAEGQAIVDLARFIYESAEDAARIYSTTPADRPRQAFETINPNEAKAYIAVARAVREALLDPAKLGDVIEAHLVEHNTGDPIPVDALVKKIREL